jgi:4-amino-4-deoxy-L-arabinose transferase-like glycosyltransferase
MLNTVAFDAVAVAIAVCAIILAVFFSYRTKRENKENMPQELPNQKSWLSRHVEAICIVAILAFSTIYLFNLGSAAFFADEQVYSQWASHMVQSGDYLTPWAGGVVAVWIAKPPLLMWLMSLSYQIFGVSTISSRIWTPLFAAMSLVLVFYLGKKMYNAVVGFTSAIVLGTFVTFYVYARAAMTDIPLLCFMLASMYFLLLSEKPQHCNLNAALGGVFFGLALMTKQAVALLIPAIIIIYWITTKRSLKFLFTRQFALFLGIGLLIFVPWVIAMYATFGSDFAQWFIMYTGVNRVTNPLEGHVGGPLFYVNFLATEENPAWVALLPFAMGLCIYRAATKKSNSDFFILIWIVLVLGVFSAAATKIYWYILPAYPAFALAIGSFLYWVSQKIWAKRKTQQLKGEKTSR